MSQGGGSSAEQRQHGVALGCGEVRFAGLLGKAGKGSDPAALFLNRKALPSQCKGRKFLLERGGLDSEGLGKQCNLIC